MNFFLKILLFLQGEMTEPKAFGWFHIMWIIFIFLFLVLLRNKRSEKNLKVILGTYGIVALVFEILKQIAWSFNYENGIVTWDYQWYAFPFQLCTTPIIISIVCVFLKENKLRDILLSYIESGLITLIGLTNSNPFHSINPAIRSRCQLLELKRLSTKDIEKGIKRVKEVLTDIKMDNNTIKYIANISDGDIRYAYNLIEFIYYGYNHIVNIENINEVNSKKAFFTDKNEDGHYDMLSAFQKSIRGSDVDASLHYLGRLIVSGDYDSIYRRMIVIAYEDIGLANPGIGPKVIAAIEASERVGYPELVKPLSVVIIEMALSPKSNSADSAINAAINDINEGNVGRIPEHIRTTSPNYKYPHNYPNYWVKQEYMPDNLIGRHYYTPRKNKYETELYNFNQKIKQ